MENHTDLINMCWEIIGGIFIIPSIKSILKTKDAKGVNWLTVMFFFTWGAWNVYFYPTNGFELSFYGGLFLCAMNLVWVLLLLKYRNVDSLRNEDIPKDTPYDSHMSVFTTETFNSTNCKGELIIGNVGSSVGFELNNNIITYTGEITRAFTISLECFMSILDKNVDNIDVIFAIYVNGSRVSSRHPIRVSNTHLKTYTLNSCIELVEGDDIQIHYCTDGHDIEFVAETFDNDMPSIPSLILHIQ